MDRTVRASGGVMAPKNIFARAMLYLELDDVERAMKDILSLDAEILIEFCVAYPQLLSGFTRASDEDQSEASSNPHCYLGELLLQCLPWVLLEVLAQIHRDALSVEKRVAILSSRVTGVEQTKKNAIILINFLEYLLMETQHTNSLEVPRHVRGAWTNKLALSYLYLCEQRVAHPRDLFAGFGDGSCPIRAQWAQRHVRAFVDGIPFWVDKLQGPTVVDDRCYVMKLQGLLLSDRHARHLNAESFLSELQKCAAFSGQDLLLCLVLASEGQLAESSTMLLAMLTHGARVEGDASQGYIQYCTKFCKEPQQWEVVLSVALQEMERAYDRESMAERRTLEHLHGSLLDYLAQTMPPQQLLAMIPNDGSLAYYMPFLLKALTRTKARNLSKRTIAVAMEFERQADATV
eukprot:TRINITY_DN3597_c0_g1_i2.p1 TRINITY_DN3597_c0_g1~~TRINITY_DN3597_c0_g1_i2.p1  ORF type:complete len:405 (-),score=81.18 TRINITY_DN3597_c0_g1_i2:45-1259(-)